VLVLELVLALVLELELVVSKSIKKLAKMKKRNYIHAQFTFMSICLIKVTTLCILKEKSKDSNSKKSNSNNDDTTAEANKAPNKGCGRNR